MRSPDPRAVTLIASSSPRTSPPPACYPSIGPRPWPPAARSSLSDRRAEAAERLAQALVGHVEAGGDAGRGFRIERAGGPNRPPRQRSLADRDAADRAPAE